MTTAAVPSAPSRLKLPTKLLYGFGSIAYGVKDQAFNTLLLIYYNQVVGLPAVWVGAAIFIALMLDACLDPLIGQTSDNWRSKWGRRHPFMYFAALPVALTFMLVWNAPHGWSHEVMFAYLIGLIILVRTLIACYEIPSAALISEFTSDYDERTSLLNYRWLFGVLGGVGMTITAFFVFLVPTADNPNGILNRDGYGHYGVVAAVVMFISIIVSAAGTHSFIPHLRQPPPKTKRSFGDFIREMKETLVNRSFIAVAASGVFGAMASGLSTGMNTYIFTYYWRITAQQLATFMLASILGVMLAFALTPLISRKLGKKQGGIVFAVLSVVIGTLPLLLRQFGLFPGPGSQALTPLLFAFATASAALGISCLIMIGSMIADVVEDSEQRTGRRSEGLFFAANSFIQKAVSGLGVFFSGLILTVAAFPQHAAPGEVDPAILQHMVLLYLPTVTVLYFASIACLLPYRISRSSHQATLATLGDEVSAAEREGVTHTP